MRVHPDQSAQMSALRPFLKLLPFGAPHSPNKDPTGKKESVWHHSPHIIHAGPASERLQPPQIQAPAESSALSLRARKGLRNGAQSDGEPLLEGRCAYPKMCSNVPAKGYSLQCYPASNLKPHRGRLGHQKASGANSPGVSRFQGKDPLGDRQPPPAGLRSDEIGGATHRASHGNQWLPGRWDRSASCRRSTRAIGLRRLHTRVRNYLPVELTLVRQVLRGAP